MYVLTRPDGHDWDKRISPSYRDAIGKVIDVTDYDPPERGLYGRGIFLCKCPNDCFTYARIPCAAFEVEGIQALAENRYFIRYRAAKVLREVQDLNKLFGWKYTEAINSVMPFKIPTPEITNRHIELLWQWASLWRDVTKNILLKYLHGSAFDAVYDYILGETFDPMMYSPWERWEKAALDTIVKQKSVLAFVRAYIGSLLFTEKRAYPLQPAVDLWKAGLVPVFDGGVWRLHCGPDGRVCKKKLRIDMRVGGVMGIPGNSVQDNWFMGNAPVSVNTLEDFLEKVEGFFKGCLLRDEKGNKLAIRMGGKGIIQFISNKEEKNNE